MSDVCLVMPYIGRVPPGFDLFKEGARRNPQIDIHCLTDQPFDSFGLDLPGNLTLHRSSLQEIQRLAEDKLAVPVSLNRPYKLCDLRPAFGLIFAELIAKYRYWGYGDFDVIWGNIQGQILENVAADLDFFTFHNLYISGALTILRNSPVLNAAFMRHANWREIMGSETHYAFDECDRRWEQHMEIGDLALIDFDPPSFSQIIYDMHRCAEIRASFSHHLKEWIGPTEILEVDHAANRVKSLEDGREFVFFHWVLYSASPGFRLPPRALGDRYYITREGFWQSLSAITPSAKLARKMRAQAIRVHRGLSRRASALLGTG